MVSPASVTDPSAPPAVVGPAATVLTTLRSRLAAITGTDWVDGADVVSSAVENVPTATAELSIAV